MPEDKPKKRLHRRLTVTAIERRKLPKTYENLNDGDGLVLKITANGKKRWKLQYDVVRGKERQRTTTTLGEYPKMSLAMARREAENVKEMGKQGINVTERKKQVETGTENKKAEQQRTFKEIAEEWLEKEVDCSKDAQYTKAGKRRMLNLHVYPKIGDVKFDNLRYKELYELLNEIYDIKKSTYALRISFILGQIWKWAKRLGYSEINITEGLSEAMSKKEIIAKQRAAILEPAQVGEFLNKIEIYKSKGSKIYSEAVELIVYLAVRSSELRGAKIDEFDFDKKIWRVPAERMKTRKEFIVPLPEKIVAKFKELISFNGDVEYVFPTKSLNGEVCCIYGVQMNKLLRKMGYKKDELQIHGFRSTFSTLMAQTDLYGQEIIDASLSHSIGNKVSRAYNRGDYLEKRRQCLEDYCYILDELKKGKDFNDIVKDLKRQHYERDMK